ADRRLPAVRDGRGARSDLEVYDTSSRCQTPVRCAAVKAIVVGCGRVGSAVAQQLLASGWDVTVLDENEDALGRLGESWTGGFVLGHGMGPAVPRAGRVQ